MTWIDGAEVDIIRSKYFPYQKLIGVQHEAVVDLIVLHSTEGMSYPGGTYKARSGRTSGIQPNFTINPHFSDDDLWQHISLAMGSYSLKSGDRSGAIQIEIMGFAADSHNWSDDALRRIGQLIAKIVKAVPTIPLVAHHPFLGAGQGLLAAPFPRGAARLSPDEWAKAEGIIGHQHATYDDHWDPGRINITRILEHAHRFLYEGEAGMELHVPHNDLATAMVEGTKSRLWIGSNFFETTSVKHWSNVKGVTVIVDKNLPTVWSKLKPGTTPAVPAPVEMPEIAFPPMPSAAEIAAAVVAALPDSATPLTEAQVQSAVVAGMQDVTWSAS